MGIRRSGKENLPFFVSYPLDCRVPPEAVKESRLIPHYPFGVNSLHPVRSFGGDEVDCPEAGELHYKIGLVELVVNSAVVKEFFDVLDRVSFEHFAGRSRNNPLFIWVLAHFDVEPTGKKVSFTGSGSTDEGKVRFLGKKEFLLIGKKVKVDFRCRRRDFTLSRQHIFPLLRFLGGLKG